MRWAGTLISMVLAALVSVPAASATTPFGFAPRAFAADPVTITSGPEAIGNDAHPQIEFTGQTTEFRCTACDKTFTADEVRELLARLHAAWDERLKWIDTRPRDANG
jgi:hypothetical protein